MEAQVISKNFPQLVVFEIFFKLHQPGRLTINILREFPNVMELIVI